MKKSSKVMLVFLSTIALASCGKTPKPIDRDKDWTVESSTNNADSVTYYHHRSGRYMFYPFIWHNSSRQSFTHTGKYAPSYFSKHNGFSVGNKSIMRGGFGYSSKGGHS
jgi:hypothetical protein